VRNLSQIRSVIMPLLVTMRRLVADLTLLRSANPQQHPATPANGVAIAEKANANAHI
jgi:hypothetical protein